MILQALYDYYQRQPELPRDGYELKEIPFVLELDAEGRLVQVLDTREIQGKKRLARSFLVPQGVKKSVNVAANLLWGNAEYVLGLPDPKKFTERQSKGKEADYQARLQEMRAAFLANIQALPEEALQDEGIRAVLAFLDQPGNTVLASTGDLGQEIASSNPNLSFRLRGDTDLVCQRRAVQSALSDKTGELRGSSICLITGETGATERLHPAIVGVRDAQTSGANIVSFNLDAFRSYGKEQGHNAPVGKGAAFAYTTALRHLLRRDSPQKLQIGDATTVFWAEREDPLENQFAALFDEPPKDDPDRGTRAVLDLIASVRQGVLKEYDRQTRFFVLGLAPNAARIAIRFWLTGTVAEMATRMVRHFRDLEIDHHPAAKPYPSIFRLLTAVAPQGKAENIPPRLGGEVMRAILEELPYPETLFQGAIRRLRAEREVNHLRAAILKACLHRKRHPNEKEISVSLDPDNTNPGYLLGRLFAVLERIQEEASPGLNATIRDRFYGAASSTPATVFPNLMKLHHHHLAKLENPGRRVNLERLTGGITNGLADFPAHLSLSDQGRFALGYYHQRMDRSTYTAGTPREETNDD